MRNVAMHADAKLKFKVPDNMQKLYSHSRGKDLEAAEFRDAIV